MSGPGTDTRERSGEEALKGERDDVKRVGGGGGLERDDKGIAGGHEKGDVAIPPDLMKLGGDNGEIRINFP